MENIKEFNIEVNSVNYTLKAAEMENGLLDAWSIEFPNELKEELLSYEDDDFFETIDNICICLDDTKLFNEEIFSIHLPI